VTPAGWKPTLRQIENLRYKELSRGGVQLNPETAAVAFLGLSYLRNLYLTDKVFQAKFENSGNASVAGGQTTN
jgi:hypothetical protein